MADVKLIPGRYYWVKRKCGTKWHPAYFYKGKIWLAVKSFEPLSQDITIHPHPIPTPDEIGCDNPKLIAIEFAKWVSDQQVLDDFWSMSIKSQEEAYELFLKESKQ